MHEGMSPVHEDIAGDMSEDAFEVVKSPVGSHRGFGAQPIAHVLKVIILGDASVGKTALIQRFVNGVYQALPYKPTVGADFYSQKIEVLDKRSNNARSLVTLQIWDTAGQERYRSLASSFYRGADVCLLVFDGSRSASLDSLDMWKSDFLKYASPLDSGNFPFIILCNKADLFPEKANASFAQEVSLRLGVPSRRVLLVSAKTGAGVETAFHMAAKTGLERVVAAASTKSIRPPPKSVQFSIPANDPFQGRPASTSCSQC